jgi:LAO/AO transport system kinase
VLRALYARTGQAFVVGVTGHPGVGKSTLVDGLVAWHRARGARVGVVAVDPSSPFSGGALLGDRVRMQRHATDEGVFIRSLASRGETGGLSRSTVAAVAVLDAMGFPVVVIETVGVGQAEVDVAGAADAVVVVTAPGLGDEVQALKAGLLEIADVLVVNKAERDGADLALKDLTTMLQLSARAVASPPALVRAVATRGEGIDDVAVALEALRAVPPATHAARRRRQAARQILAIVSEVTRTRARALLGPALAATTDENASPPAPTSGATLDAVDAVASRTVDAVAARLEDPWTAADELSRLIHR